MGWIIFLVIIAFIIFIISKSGPAEIKGTTIPNRQQLDFNLKDYPNQYAFSVSGVQLQDYIYPVLNICKELDVVNLIPEPNNTYDSNAIKVEVSKWHIGYVPESETDLIHSIIKKEYIAYIETREIIGYIRVVVKIRYKN